MMKEKVIICDLDNCLFDSRELIKHTPSENTREAWNEFHKKYYLCKNNPIIINLIELYATQYIILFLTGRESTQDVSDFTIRSIFECFEDNAFLTQSSLFMRNYDDYRPDYVVKEELLKKHILPQYEPILAIDDKKENIDMFQKYGIQTLYYTIGG